MRLGPDRRILAGPSYFQRDVPKLVAARFLEQAGIRTYLGKLND